MTDVSPGDLIPRPRFARERKAQMLPPSTGAVTGDRTAKTIQLTFSSHAPRLI